MRSTPTPQTERQPSMQLGVLLCLVAGVIGLVISVLGALTDLSRFFQVYLSAFVLVTEIAVGCLGLVLLNSLVSGRWLFATQRIAEAASRTLPLLALLFVPVILGLSDIYPWAQSEVRETLSANQAGWLDPAFFVIRTYIYFGVWIVLATWITNRSYNRDINGAPGFDEGARNFAAVGMVIFVITTTLAAFDWTMSLTPEWFSSIYGWLSLSRSALAAFAFIILLLAFYWGRPPLRRLVNERVFGDLALLLLVALLVWMYMNLIQFVLIWAGNLTYNVSWYEPRLAGWIDMTNVLLVLHLALALILLLPGLKRIRAAVLLIAVVLLILRVTELYWVVMPSFEPAGGAIQWWDGGPMLALAGFWLAATLWLLGRQRLLPVYHQTLGAENSLAEDAEGAEATPTPAA
ncbi:MAG: hypothetical protein GYB67_01640 [Chloroflexi bacterium]|nr:hypothetical protein [Chloroflexota bacterium]